MKVPTRAVQPGEIVQYVLAILHPGRLATPVVRPAMVLRCWSGGAVNLHVFLDARDMIDWPKEIADNMVVAQWATSKSPSAGGEVDTWHVLAVDEQRVTNISQTFVETNPERILSTFREDVLRALPLVVMEAAETLREHAENVDNVDVTGDTERDGASPVGASTVPEDVARAVAAEVRALSPNRPQTRRPTGSEARSSESQDPILRWFTPNEFSPSLAADASQRFKALAAWLVQWLPSSWESGAPSRACVERDEALRKLLDAKDACVRAFKTIPES